MDIGFEHFNSSLQNEFSSKCEKKREMTAANKYAFTHIEHQYSACHAFFLQFQLQIKTNSYDQKLVYECLCFYFCDYNTKIILSTNY